VPAKRLELTGRTFGRWLVLAFSHSNGHYTYWKCRCACGTIRKVRGTDLTLPRTSKGTSTLSCGCLQKEISRKSPGVSAQTSLWNGYRGQARRRGLTFEISKEVFLKLTTLPCHYCGSPHSNISRAPDGNGDFLCNGLDRKDSSLGYLEGNLVPCCKICQRAKMAMPYVDFLEYLHRVVEFRR